VSLELRRADWAVMAAFISTFLWFSVNALVVWIGWLYLNLAISAAVLTLAALRWDGPGYLKHGVIAAIGGALIYSIVDRLFVRMVMVLSYLRRDVPVFSTPLSVVLTWALMIEIGIYLYLRMREFTGRFYIPALIIGALAFASTIGLSELGSAGRIWVWNISRAPRPFIAHTPLYTALANFFVPFTAPYVVQHRIIGAIRCGVAISAIQLACYIFFFKIMPIPL